MKTYLQTRTRINSLIDLHLPITTLSDRLTNLPNQFSTPQQRPWDPINWQQVDRQQILNVKPDLFLKVLANAAEIEDPIRSYALESWHYLVPLHPAMAQFIGGELEGDRLIRPGVWEREERQHGPLFRKLYQQLSGEKLQPKPNSVAGHTPGETPWADLRRHLLSRITAEWSATATYLWLLAHSTGELHNIIAQPFQDEINHLAKFWGFTRWLYQDSFYTTFKTTCQTLLTFTQHHRQERTDGSLFFQPHKILQNAHHGIELSFTFLRIMTRLRRWDQELSPSFLRHLLGVSPLTLEAIG